MYTCGLRVSEATALQVNQINSDNHTLTIIGKGNKERLVPIADEMLQQLRHFWLTHRHPVYLFPNKSGSKIIWTGTLSKAFRSGVKKANLRQQDATPHSLRHSYATRLIEYGVDIAIVQRLLGHSSIKSTVIYTHLTAHTRERVQEVISFMMSR